MDRIINSIKRQVAAPVTAPATTRPMTHEEAELAFLQAIDRRLVAIQNSLGTLVLLLVILTGIAILGTCGQVVFPGGPL